MQKQIAALAADESTMVMWDIDELLLKCKDRPFVTVDTAVLAPREWLTIDTDYAGTTDVSLPIILFELPDQQLYIADGNHRLYRAVNEAIPQMNVIVIPEEKHLAYLFKSTEETYRRVVEGLKDEGIFIDNFMKSGSLKNPD